MQRRVASRWVATFRRHLLPISSGLTPFTPRMLVTESSEGWYPPNTQSQLPHPLPPEPRITIQREILQVLVPFSFNFIQFPFIEGYCIFVSAWNKRIRYRQQPPRNTTPEVPACRVTSSTSVLAGCCVHPIVFLVNWLSLRGNLCHEVTCLLNWHCTHRTGAVQLLADQHLAKFRSWALWHRVVPLVYTVRRKNNSLSIQP